MLRNSDIQTGRSPNERLGASGAVTRPKVCANLQVIRPSERQWKPRLRQAASPLCAMRGRHTGGETDSRKKVEVKTKIIKQNGEFLLQMVRKQVFQRSDFSKWYVSQKSDKETRIV